MIEQRRADVQTIYETADFDLALKLLRQYGVDYIYLGDLERAYYFGPGPGEIRADGRIRDHAGLPQRTGNDLPRGPELGAPCISSASA